MTDNALCQSCKHLWIARMNQINQKTGDDTGEYQVLTCMYSQQSLTLTLANKVQLDVMACTGYEEGGTELHRREDKECTTTSKTS